MFYQINYNENGIKIKGHCPKIFFLLFFVNEIIYAQILLHFFVFVENFLNKLIQVWKI
jgi:hypothetical protein